MNDSRSTVHREGGFRMRGAEMSRIDAFSDVVFGFALTLLVVSLEVPKNFAELHESIRGFVPFAICFLLLLMVWHSHYVFFRRYGLHDRATILLNSCLLFVVLFFVYPLKFLFTLLTNQITGAENVAHFTSGRQVTELMVLYGLGFAAVHLLLASLYWNAWRQRDTLELSGLERLLTLSSVVELAGVAAVGLLSTIVSLLLPTGYAGYAGYIYFLIGVWKTLHGIYFGRKARVLTSLPASGSF